MVVIKKNKVKIALLSFSIFLTCCFSNVEKQHVRNKCIPENTVWVGGSDGGVWVSVDKTSINNAFFIKIYNEQDGTLWGEGKFILDENCCVQSITPFEIKRNLEAWTGQNFLLNIIGKDKRYCQLYPQD